MEHSILDPRFLNTVLNSVSCGVLTTDRNQVITSFNWAAEQITGWKSEDALGKPCYEVMRCDALEFGCPLHKTLAAGGMYGPVVSYIRHKDGRNVPVRMIARAMRDEKGNLIGAVQSYGDLSTVFALRQKLEKSYVFHDIISRNHAMQQLFEALPRIAESSSTVMIRGESGTGKELVARAIHNLSPRKSYPFVAVNCAALPDTLLEAELFGYIKGAFTDARKDREGRISAAEGGTLMLDEVGDLSPSTQVKLLRFLQNHEFEPLGSSQTKRVNVRIIAATHRNLEELIEKEMLRVDFYYRLNVISVEIPPLRDRIEDVPLLANHFMERWSSINDKQITALEPDSLHSLMQYDFPGNVRELENIVERAAVMTIDNKIKLEDLPHSIARKSTKNSEEDEPPVVDSLTQLENAEKEMIASALSECDQNKGKAAETLGISRTTLWRKMKQFHLD